MCSTCALQLENCPICRQEIQERQETSGKNINVISYPVSQKSETHDDRLSGHESVNSDERTDSNLSHVRNEINVEEEKSRTGSVISVKIEVGSKTNPQVGYKTPADGRDRHEIVLNNGVSDELKYNKSNSVDGPKANLDFQRTSDNGNSGKKSFRTADLDPGQPTEDSVG